MEYNIYLDAEKVLRKAFGEVAGEFAAWALEIGEGNGEARVDCKLTVSTHDAALEAAFNSGSGRIDVHGEAGDYAALREVTRNGEAYSADNADCVLSLDDYSAQGSACYEAAQKLQCALNARRDALRTIEKH